MLRYIGLYLLLLLVPIFAVFFTIGDASCPPNGGFGDDWIIVKILLGSFLVVGLAIAIGLRNVNDSHNIRKDLLVSTIVGVPFFIIYVLWFALDVDALSPKILGYFNPIELIAIWALVVHSSAVVSPLYVVLKEEFETWRRTRSKEQIALDEASFWQLIIKGGKTWQEFREFAARDFCVENALFIEDIQILHDETACQLLRSKAIFPKPTTDRRISTSTESTRSFTSQKAHPFWADVLPPSAGSAPVPPDLQGRWKNIAVLYIDDNAPSQLNLPDRLVHDFREKVS
ncbi:hypothetical protein M427DRAFT_31871 [Gonapodya prolifera JEL478]|uniref:RGS domain-containing protein n=1 Tax=Gonapodya prolifera (strain JEL478) TaxID=1344416 RepID=A0A139AGP1_GONPJ|nr:hypothetical protein M427DRAFT_31871 [Gonapodya prolifera JEL478]|eukprot:KXS15920.1 hypothetical protein M427DRAFT_31871 [Gonapodya prolifera JEL478]